jgi:hypothetical protein
MRARLVDEVRQLVHVERLRGGLGSEPEFGFRVSEKEFGL